LVGFPTRREEILNPVRVSIVIPTYRREEKLNRLLLSVIESSSSLDYEIIVVDDSEVETRISKDIRFQLEGRLEVIHNPVRCFITKAKNIGWSNSSGVYIFFIDDDNILPKGTMEALV